MAYVEHELDRVEVACGLGSMALFGETVFVVDVDELLPNRTTVATEVRIPYRRRSDHPQQL